MKQNDWCLHKGGRTSIVRAMDRIRHKHETEETDSLSGQEQGELCSEDTVVASRRAIAAEVKCWGSSPWGILDAPARAEAVTHHYYCVVTAQPRRKAPYTLPKDDDCRHHLHPCSNDDAHVTVRRDDSTLLRAAKCRETSVPGKQVDQILTAVLNIETSADTVAEHGSGGHDSNERDCS